jgi:hypothetical protein
LKAIFPPPYPQSPFKGGKWEMAFKTTNIRPTQRIESEVFQLFSTETEQTNWTNRFVIVIEEAHAAGFVIHLTPNWVLGLFFGLLFFWLTMTVISLKKGGAFSSPKAATSKSFSEPKKTHAYLYNL